MEPIILAIMLYLSYIVSPGQYYQHEIDAIYDANEVTIQAVHTDPVQMQVVEAEFLPQTEYVLVDEFLIAE